MWAIHRYRVPPATYAAFARMQAEGRITMHRGRVRGGTANARGITLHLAAPDRAARSACILRRELHRA